MPIIKLYMYVYIYNHKSTAYLSRYPDDDKDVFDDAERPYIRLSKYNRPNRQAWYGGQIEKLGKQNRVMIM